MRARKFVSPGGIIVLLVSFVFMYATGIAGKPPRKFIYGIWGDAFDSSFTPHPLMAAFVPADQGSKFTVRMNILQDTLGFNMALNRVYNHVTAESLINRGFNVIESDSSYSPGKPSDYAWSWYLTWQSDANSIPPWYIGNYASYRGRRTFDSVGGRWDTVWVIGNQSGDTPGWVVKTGDSHFILKDLNTFGAPQRRASFKLKATGATGSNPVARIAAVRRDGPNIIDTLASRVILRNEFAGGYQDFDISWPQNKVSPLAGQFWEQYLLYWYGNDTLYFDEALSTDVIGSNVMAGVYDSNINGYTTTCTYGTNGSYLLGWWLLDGRTAPETAAPWGYIDSRLRLGAGQKGGFQNFEDEEYANAAVHMLKLDYMVCTSYPTEGSHCDGSVIDDSGAVSFSTDNPGGDSVSLQTGLNKTTARLRKYKLWADSLGIIMWAKPGPFQWFQQCNGMCYEKLRRPSGAELLAISNLALAYGADALSFFKWGSDSCYVLGMVHLDSEGNITHRYQSYYDIRDMVSPFIDSLGDRFYDLKWIDAGGSDAVNSINGSFIDSVVSEEFPAEPYVEVAFFEDTTVVSPEFKNYFFLVNRRCLPSETQTICVYLNRFSLSQMRGVSNQYMYIIDQYSYDSILVDAGRSSQNPEAPPTCFSVLLAPGQGKLFYYHPPCNCGRATTPKMWADVSNNNAIGPEDVVRMVNYVYRGQTTAIIAPPGTTYPNAPLPAEPPYTCHYKLGDANIDGAVGPPDVVRYVNYVYKSQTTALLENPCLVP